MAGNGNSRRFQDFMPHLTSMLTFRALARQRRHNLSYAIHMDGKDLTKADHAFRGSRPSTVHRLPHKEQADSQPRRPLSGIDLTPSASVKAGRCVQRRAGPGINAVPGNYRNSP